MTSQRPAIRAAVGVGALILQGLAVSARGQNPSVQAPAQAPAIVSGVFVDSAGTPIRHAVLSVVGESLRVVTDSQGRFRLAVPAGPKLLAARALGYRPLMWTVTLVSGQETSGRIRLQQLSVVLPEITVVGAQYVPSRLAGFYQRRRLGLGKYVDSVTIQRRFTNSIADLLQEIPGVRVSPVPGDPFHYLVSFARCNLIGQPTGSLAGQPATTGRERIGMPERAGQSSSPTGGPSLDARAKSAVGVYVDGFRVPGDAGEILAMINAADVEAIEVYRGPSELPADFMSDDCAAIVIWTRY